MRKSMQQKNQYFDFEIFYRIKFNYFFFFINIITLIVNNKFIILNIN